MSPAVIAAHDACLVGVLAHVGTDASYRVGGIATAVSLVVSVAELADDTAQRPHGHERTRLADILIRRAALSADPVHGDTLTIASGAHAGTWTVLGIERRDEVAPVIRCRRSVRVDAATLGAVEVRR